MAKNKTTAHTGSVIDFINTVKQPQKRSDSLQLKEIMEAMTGLPAKMWGPAIIGFGSYHYIYDSGHSGDAPLVAFSPRAANIALYIANFEGKPELLQQLGKHKMAKSCVYINKIEDIDTEVFKKLVSNAVAYMKNKYPA